MDEYEDKLKAKLAPESVVRTLIHAGCFLSAYELIKSEVIDHVHEFFWYGFKDGKHFYDEARYQESVASRDPKSHYRASCAWLVEMDALTAAQVVSLEEIQKHRHEIAHELPKLLIDPNFKIKTDLLVAGIECVRRLGVFWGSMEVDLDPAWDGREVNYDGIKSGPYLLMDYLATIAGLAPTDATKT